VLAQVAAEEHVLRQPEGHPDRGRPETDVEADARLQQPGDQWTEEGAEIDTEIEQREPAVGPRIPLLVQRSEQRGGVGLECTTSQRDEHEPDPDAAEAGQYRQRNMSGHDDDSAVEDHAFHAEHPVGEPPAKHRRQVHQAAVGADDSGRRGLRQAEPTLLQGVVQVIAENGEHPVEREPLPQLDA
jgi:hypothetical protein